MRKTTTLMLALSGLLILAPEAHPARAAACDPSYPDYCIPPPPPDLDCGDVHGPKPFRVRQPDPHHFDRDHDGWGCEPRPRRRR